MKLKNYITLMALALSLSSRAQLADGSIAPDFTLTDLSGNSHNLYTYLNQGKTVFIDFFACHCPTCWAYHNQHELEALNNLHGPAGIQTQDVVVLAIEYDANNGYNEFNGISGNTQGNWLSGVSYPFINPEGTDRAILTTYAVNYFPLVYGICPDKSVVNVGTLTASQFYTYASSCIASGIAVASENEVIVTLSNNTLFVRSEIPMGKIVLYDMQGKNVLSSEIESKRTFIPVDDLARGIYYYKADVCGKVFRGKLIN